MCRELCFRKKRDVTTSGKKKKGRNARSLLRREGSRGRTYLEIGIAAKEIDGSLVDASRFPHICTKKKKRAQVENQQDEIRNTL